MALSRAKGFQQTMRVGWGSGGGGLVVNVGLPSLPTIRVRIPLKPTVYSVKFVFIKYENKQKETRFYFEKQ